MKYFITLCFFMINISIQAQDKQVKYFDKDSAEITYKVFSKIKKKQRYKQTVFTNETDSLIVKRLVSVVKKSRLNPKDFDALKNVFRIDSTKISVIIYLPKKHGKPKQAVSTWNIFDTDFRYFFNKKKTSKKKQKDIQLFWITAPNNKDLKHYRDWAVHWQEDKQNLIVKTFFKSGVRYSAYIIIQPNGSYEYYFGEFSKKRVLERLKKI